MLLNEIIVKQDGGYVVYSHDRKRKLSRVYKTEKQAKARLAQIHWWQNIANDK